MIEVERLTKRYGALRAVDRLDFAVGRGEIVGFLGPNGAGKTTTMRLLTTYLPPTSGRARLAGLDVIDDPIGVRRRVGYLPENVPLYGEMRVTEYLRYRARVKDVPRARRASAVDGSVERCGLDEVCDRIVGQLSRGYRQRVGLADALVHDPEILILDEPTAGLDPIQNREVRSVIRNLGSTHTVLLSTHILPEVEAICSRVLVVARGRLAIDDSLDRVRSEASIAVEVRGPAEAARRVVETTPGVARVVAREAPDGASFDVTARPGDDPREAIAQRIISNGWGLRRLDARRSTLEERFVQAVRDADLAAAAEGAGGDR